jgi:hypothetical protein
MTAPVTDDVDAVVLVPVRTPLKAPVVEEIPAENVLSPVKVFVLRVAPVTEVLLLGAEIKVCNEDK